MFGREASLFRRCVPFHFNVSGPVAAVAQRTFERYPHTFTMALEALEELDSTPYPKMLFAEALQAMAVGTVEQRVVRELFEKAEQAARDESNGEFDRERWNFDPEYRLNAYLLHMSAGWWERMLRVHPRPWEEAEVFAHHRYASDVRRDTIISNYTGLVLSEAGRGQITEDVDRLIEMLLIVERDLYGTYRFDRRGDQKFLVQSVKLGDVGKNPETSAGLLDGLVKAFGRSGHFRIDTEDHQGRWKKYTVRCLPEDDPAPWSELVEVPELRRVYNPNIPRLNPSGKATPVRALASRRGAGSETPEDLLTDGTSAAADSMPGPGRPLGPSSLAAAPAPTPSAAELGRASTAHARALAPHNPAAYASLLGSQPAGFLPTIPSEGYSTLSHEEIADGGYVRVHFDTMLVPRRELRDNMLYYEFDLAIIKPEVGYMPRKVGEMYGI